MDQTGGPVRRSRRHNSHVVGFWLRNLSLVTRRTFPYVTPCSTFRHTVGNGLKSGSQPTGRGCCGPPDGMPTPGFPSFSLGPPITPAHLRPYALRHPTPARDPMSITPAVNRAVVTSRNRDDVDEALDSVIMKSSALAAPAEAWARHGVSIPWEPTSPACRIWFHKRSTSRQPCHTQRKSRRHS